MIFELLMQKCNPRGPCRLDSRPLRPYLRISSVQFSCSVMSDSLQPHGLQHTSPPCPSPTPRVYSCQCLLIELMIPSNHLSLCHPLLLPPSVFPSIRVFSNESTLRMRWPKYWSFSFSISPSNERTNVLFSSVQSLSRVRLFATPWTAAHQAFQSITNSQSLLKLMSIKSVIPSNYLILSCPFLLLPSVFPRDRKEWHAHSKC